MKINSQKKKDKKGHIKHKKNNHADNTNTTMKSNREE